MKQNLEQFVNRIIQAAKISSPPINAESLAEFYFADKFASNVGFKNFTVAHELGHWVLHRNSISKRSPEIEREADLFAVYLLMPETFVRNEFAKLNSSRLLRCLSAEMKLQTMSSKFCVSLQAMRIRLSQDELKLIYVAKDGKCYRSREDKLIEST